MILGDCQVTWCKKSNVLYTSQNLLGRNTTRRLWKLPLHGDWITHTAYFDRVDQTLLSLFKIRECVIINIQAGRRGSHKHSLQIIQEYSKKWQKNDDLKEIWPGVLCTHLPAGRKERQACDIHILPAWGVKIDVNVVLLSMTVLDILLPSRFLWLVEPRSSMPHFLIMYFLS